LESEPRRKEKTLAAIGAGKKVRGHLGGRGKMISCDERQMAMELIDEAMNAGARQEKACEVVGIAGRTYQRWQHAGLQDQRQVVEKHPANQLGPIGLVLTGPNTAL
jgi:hypothetical protein